MITIQAAMLVTLGFCAAALVVFLLAPLYRRRAARLATDDLKRSMPLTLAEISADKDRVRAEYAIKVHKLEAKIETSELSAARQMVDINRRDAAISALEGEVAKLRGVLEEHENARRVLEQTITERLPKVEHRLADAKKLLFQRDREISSLTQSSQRQAQALEEATQINAQQRDELHRLRATVTTRSARNREPGTADPRFDAEVALRTEIETLRAKTRDQSAVIERLQGVVVAAGGERPAALGPASGAEAGLGSDSEIARLRNDLAEAELALRSVRGTAEAEHVEFEAKDAQLRALKTKTEDQTAEIARLSASLRTYQDASSDERAIKESKITLKARLSALQALSGEQASTIQSLRTEIAAANEKYARQAQKYMDEMRRLGAGTRPVSGSPQKVVEGPSAQRQTLADRISTPRPPRDEETSRVNGSTTEKADPWNGGLLRALGSREAAPSDGAASKTDEPVVPEAPAGENAAVNGPRAAPRLLGLLERITGTEKPAR